MRAAQLVRVGKPPVFEVRDVADPEPGPGEVVVDLVAAALNRRDWWIWRGPVRDELPVTLGSDGAGVVAAVGAGVESVRPDDEVVIDATLNWGEREDRPTAEFDILGGPTPGTLAEKIVVPAGNVYPRPQRLTWVESAALNLGGLTAWRAAVTCAGATLGRTILVIGAGSGVSTFLIQIAVARGARVLVTSGSDEKIERARGLGAERGFRYDHPDWPAQAREATGGGFDAVVDSFGAPSWAAALKTLRDGGVLVNFGDTGGDEAVLDVADVYWHWRSIVGTTMGSPREFRALLAHVAAADWRPVIDSVFPLQRVADAAARLDDRDRFGKVALTIRPEAGPAKAPHPTSHYRRRTPPKGDLCSERHGS